MEQEKPKEKKEKKNNQNPKKEASKMGRPKKEIDWKMFAKYCEVGCTEEEICDFFGISPDTLLRRIKEENGEDATFAEVYKKNNANIKMSLRRAQLRSAFNGNVTMQIFLGKQILGQSDKIENTNQGDNNKITINIVETEKPLSNQNNDVE